MICASSPTAAPFPNAGLQHLYCLHSAIRDRDALNDRQVVVALDYR
jgi:hypothetical protein